MPSHESAGTVILVHGLWMTGLELQWMARGLRSGGFHVRTFRYPSVRADLKHNAGRLAEFHAQIAAASSHGRTHLVGHSLGGLVIAQMLQAHPDTVGSTGRVVALGTPFLGSASAKVISGFPLGGSVVGSCFPAAEEVARLPASLPCEAWTHPPELGIIAGSYSFGVGRLLRVFSTANDGVVAVEETQLPGAAAHLVLPINHLALTLSGRAIQETCHFLRNGRFAEPGHSAAASAVKQAVA